MSVKCLPPHTVLLYSQMGFTFFFFFFFYPGCGYSLVSPRRGGSNVYTLSMFCAKILKDLIFSDEMFNVLHMKRKK